MASAKNKGEDAELLALVDWAVEQRRDFQTALSKEPRLHKEVYAIVEAFCTEDYCAASTSSVVRLLQRKASETGVRGSLSRLVERGFLVRPRTGFYWPSDRALEEQGDD